MRTPTSAGRPSRQLLLTGLAAAVLGLSSHTAERVRRIEYADLPPALHDTLAAAGLGGDRFSTSVDGIDAETDRRVAEGDREHLIHYALQSTRFTSRPRIEPALSARGFIDGLPRQERQRLLADRAYVPTVGWPSAERARMTALLTALRRGPQDSRQRYFSEIVHARSGSPTADAFYPDYVRVARFLYHKEFTSGQDARQVAEWYQSRAHSSDTQIEAGFGVSIGLGVLQGLEPARRIRRVLIVGPGLDLAPRTDLIEANDPLSYQPLAVADALLQLSLASAVDLGVHSVDVNPRVVRALQATAGDGMTWHLFSGIAETVAQPFSGEYRDYLRGLGRAIGVEQKALAAIAADPRYQRSLVIRPSVATTMSAGRMNVVTERLVDGPPFDIAIATNVLTYFDDRQLALALSNIASMLGPRGFLLHNEDRASLPGMAAAMGLPAVHRRTVRLGGSVDRPLYDIVWLHQKTGPGAFESGVGGSGVGTR